MPRGHDPALETPGDYDDAVRAFLQTVSKPRGPQSGTQFRK
jgi:hypothetical protein